MMIVLFHVLYLFGKYIYRNYKVNRRKAVDDAEMDTAQQFQFSEADYMRVDPEAPEDYTTKPLKFFPPAYVQRYVAVCDVLNSPKYSGKLRKVVDFGCSELGFVVYLKNTPGVEEILCVDIDKQTLDTYKEKAAPLLADHIHTRSTPLVIEICEGSVTHNDKKLENTDAVICIELIEHLYPDTLRDLPENIFGFIKPKVAVMTTPNADFNVLFPNFSGFRHPDHKFEWTRQEFEEWAKNITLKYPEYDVTFDGICKGPEGTEHLGACSQMAIFHRLSDYRDDFGEPVEGLFNTIVRHEYPMQVDNRSDDQKILDEATYHIRRVSYQDPDLEEEVPLNRILGMLKSFNVSKDTLRTILEEAGWSIVDRESEPTILIPQPSWSDCEDGHWSDYSATNEDDWEAEPGPPTHSNTEEEDWNNPNWDEEPSIVIPQNNSVVQDNTYLFDGDNVTLDSGLAMRDNAASAVSSVASIDENLDRNPRLFSNVDRMSVDDLNESFQQNVHPDLNESMALSDSSFSMNLEEVQEDSLLDHIRSSSVREDTVQQLNHMLQFPVCINTSRASTSPEPYLLQAVQMDHRLKHDSLCGESMSDWMMNNSFSQADVSQELSKKNDSAHYNNFGSLYSNASRKERESPSPEAVNSSRNASTSVRDLSTEDQPQWNTSGSLAGCSIADNQPQFTSSPKVETKMHATGTKRRSLNLCEETNSLPCTIKRLQLIGLDSNNSLESISKPLQSDEEEFAEILSADYDKKDTSSDTTLTDSSVSTATSTLNDSQTMEESAGDKRLQLADLRSIKPECSDVNSSKSTCHYTKDSNSKVSPTSEVVAGTLKSTSVLKPEKQGEHAAEANKDANTNSAEVAEGAEPKPFSPETPPNSWSPEVMDSGYPNSASAPDMTPEYDLSSIAQDHISDSEPPSIAEAPRPEVLEVVEVVEVENGDLANNNRDGEGNNMMAAQLNELEDLQPLIDVLENDLENENDIYAMENDFPMWLLRILNMANPIDVEMQIRERREIGFPDGAGGDERFMNMDRDEGFDSSSTDGSDLENHEIGEDDNSEENVAMDSENASHSDSGSDRWPAGRT